MAAGCAQLLVFFVGVAKKRLDAYFEQEYSLKLKSLVLADIQSDILDKNLEEKCEGGSGAGFQWQEAPSSPCSSPLL